MSVTYVGLYGESSNYSDAVYGSGSGFTGVVQESGAGQPAKTDFIVNNSNVGSVYGNVPVSSFQSGGISYSIPSATSGIVGLPQYPTGAIGSKVGGGYLTQSDFSTATLPNSSSTNQGSIFQGIENGIGDFLSGLTKFEKNAVSGVTQPASDLIKSTAFPIGALLGIGVLAFLLLRK
jgi:hypothetical protein